MDEFGSFLAGILLCCFITCLMPAISFVFGHGVDLKKFREIFERDDSSTYYTETLINEMKTVFVKQVNSWRPASYVFLAMIFIGTSYDMYFGIFHEKEPSSTIYFWAFLIVYFIGSCFLFVNLGNAEANLELVTPLNQQKRNELESLIVESSHQEYLIDFINRNPKPELVYLDLLNIKHRIKILEVDDRQTALAGLLK